MAIDLNQLSLIGRLTWDAELKYIPTGTAKMTFSIANGYQTKKGDNWEEAVSFFNCELWGKRAESVHQYLTKGKQIGIQGVLRQDRWVQDGQNKNRIYIHVNSLQLLGGKKEGNQVTSEENPTHRNETNNTGVQTDTIGDSLPKANLPEFNDEIPF